MKKTIAIKCKNCSKIVFRYISNKRKYCSSNCYWISLRGKKTWNTGLKMPERSGRNHPSWKNGKTIMNTGYIAINAMNKKLEHRFVMETYLGREIATAEHVHHINGDKTDNRIENLIILSRQDHAKLHSDRRWKNHIKVGTFKCKDTDCIQPVRAMEFCKGHYNKNWRETHV